MKLRHTLLTDPMKMEDLEKLENYHIVVNVPISLDELLDIRPIEFLGLIESKILDDCIVGSITNVVYRVSGFYEEGIWIKIHCNVEDALTAT